MIDSPKNTNSTSHYSHNLSPLQGRIIQITFFQVLKMCRVISLFWSFEENCCLHPQGDWILGHNPWNVTDKFTVANHLRLHLKKIQSLRRRKQHVPPKRPNKHITLHDVINHNTQFSTHRFDTEWGKLFTSNRLNRWTSHQESDV
jgi:hypothetical protein